MVCLPDRERFSGPAQRPMTTAVRMTKALARAGTSPSPLAVAALKVPCHNATARMLPPVLLYSQVRTTAPAIRLTMKATTPNRLIPG